MRAAAAITALLVAGGLLTVSPPAAEAVGLDNGWAAAGPGIASAARLSTADLVAPVNGGAVGRHSLPVAPAVTAPTLTILDFAPRMPDSRKPTTTMKITVEIDNQSPDRLDNLDLQIDRGNPITTESALQLAIATPPPALDIDLPGDQVDGSIAPGASRKVTVGVKLGTGGLCLGCGPEAGSVYPIDVSLHDRSSGIELARAHTLLPSFTKTPKPVAVDWIWPLIDGPHRALKSTVFTDDTLATSVAAGGRLDRALQVAERVRGKVAMTLVVDPDLIDSLVVMSHGYRVAGTGKLAGTDRAGSGQAAAAAWLKRLHGLSDGVDVQLTPYADPDIDALARADIALPVTLESDVADRVDSVLGRTSGTFVWPAGEHLSSKGLDAVVATGTRSVLLDDSSLPGRLGGDATPDALSPLPAASGTATAVVLDSALQTSLADLIAAKAGATVPSIERRLFAQLAVRAAHEPQSSHFVVLAPRRYVDADPAGVSRAMLDLVATPWSSRLSLDAALRSVAKVDRGVLAPGGGPAPISIAQTDALTDVRSRVNSLRECITNDGARQLMGGYNAALNRGTSSWWRQHPAAGRSYVHALLTQITAQEAAIHLVSPSNSQFTLASSDSPLYITVENSLPVTASFGLKVEQLNGEVGFRTDPIPLQTIDSGDRKGIKVSTHVARSGRFQILVSLLSPAGTPLGRGVAFRINSTAYGRAALWITGVAFGVLVLALAVRGVRRTRRLLRRRGRSGRHGPRPDGVAGPAPDRRGAGGPTTFPAPQ